MWGGGGARRTTPFVEASVDGWAHALDLLEQVRSRRVSCAGSVAIGLPADEVGRRVPPLRAMQQV